MLFATRLARCTQRNWARLYVQQTAASTSPPADAQRELEHKWITAENRDRCIADLKRVPPIGMKLKNNEREHHDAAVLITLCTDIATQRVSLVFTRRSAMLSRHKRQISFPGGMRDDTDKDFIDCALRETEEEIGLCRDRVEIWGEGELVRPPHTAAIMPVVGFVRDLDINELTLNPQEVEEVIIVPVAVLLQPKSFGHTQFRSGFSSPVFVVGEHRIWGVTGFITLMFLKCLVPPELGGLSKRVRFVRPYKGPSAAC